MREIKGVTLYQCEKCNRYYWTKQSAERCCPTIYCEDCGKELTNHCSVCEKCNEKRIYDRAEKLTYEEYIKKYPGNMLYYNEKYYADLEDLLDDFVGEKIPEYCYGTTAEKIEIDIDYAIENAEEDMEDSFFDRYGLQELREYMQKWNREYGYNSFWENPKVIVIIPEVFRIYE